MAASNGTITDVLEMLGGLDMAKVDAEIITAAKKLKTLRLLRASLSPKKEAKPRIKKQKATVPDTWVSEGWVRPPKSSE